VTSFFFGVGENLGNYFALRIEFSGSFKGIDGLGPLVADGIEAAQSEPQGPIVWPPFQFPLNQDNSKAGREVLAAFSEFVPPAGQITPPHPCPVKSLFHRVRPRRNLTGRALSLPEGGEGCWEVSGFGVAGKNLRLSTESSIDGYYPTVPGCPSPPDGKHGRIDGLDQRHCNPSLRVNPCPSVLPFQW
jgi:hypothetical protein